LQAILENRCYRFEPGEAVTAKVPLKTNMDSVLVFYDNAGLEQEGRYLFVAQENKPVDLRMILTEQRYDDFILINISVSAGEIAMKAERLIFAPG
jgi:hypothetical protein